MIAYNDGSTYTQVGRKWSRWNDRRCHHHHHHRHPSTLCCVAFTRLFFYIQNYHYPMPTVKREREVLNRAGVGYLDSSHDHFMRISATLFLSFFLFLFLSLPLLIFTHVLIYAMIYIGSLSIFFSFSWFLFLLSLFPGFRLIHSLRSFRRLYRDFVFILYYC